VIEGLDWHVKLLRFLEVEEFEITERTDTVSETRVFQELKSCVYWIEGEIGLRAILSFLENRLSLRYVLDIDLFVVFAVDAIVNTTIEGLYFHEHLHAVIRYPVPVPPCDVYSRS
jgi:hypothetical protein